MFTVGEERMPAYWSPRELAHIALFTAAVMALGYALAWVPNVELMTLTIFLAGWLLGVVKGAVVGCMSAVLFSLFNPWGPPLPPVLVAQALGHSLVGVAGGALGMSGVLGVRPLGALITRRGDLLGAVMMGAVGAFLTLFYDVSTNLAHAVAMGLTHKVWAVIAAGLSFGFFHIVSNTAIFALLGPPSLRLVESRRGWL